MPPSISADSQPQWFAWRSFLLTMFLFLLFVGVVAAALRLDTLTPLPVIQATPPTIVPTAVPLANPTLLRPTATVAPLVNTEVAAAPLTPTHLITVTTINGIPFDQIVIMPSQVVAHVQAIYAVGQSLGRNPHAFTKIGDSTIDVAHFLSPFETGPYELGPYAFLQPTISHFAGSFSRQGMAVRIGLHSWTALDPLWADKTICTPAETVIACEFRLHNPSLVLIRLGANDMGVPEQFARNMSDIVTYALEQGVIPILGTKADRAEGSDENNAIIRQIAADYEIPLWDFDRVAATLPGRGLDEDGVHLNIALAHDYRQPELFTRGHAVHNLTALVVLDTIRREIMNDEG